MSEQQQKEWSELFQNPQAEDFPSIAEGLKRKPEADDRKESGSQGCSADEPSKPLVSEPPKESSTAESANETVTPSKSSTATESTSGTPTVKEDFPKIELRSGANGATGQPTVTNVMSFKNLALGSKVRITGLLSEAGKKLNGKVGIVRALDLESPGRWAVEIDGVRKSLKADNLEAVEEGAPAAVDMQAAMANAMAVHAAQQQAAQKKAAARSAKLRENAPVEEGKSYAAAALKALNEEEKTLLEKDESEDELDGTIKQRENMNTFFDLDSAIKAGAVPEDLPGLGEISKLQRALLEKDQKDEEKDDSEK